ncbi:hypothetical protein NM688_g7242 [Phlebia brevispora]|uniref:Uncharacterized protein n=1 Tax=Phlebia brevispora TaxID=194682 RepID=A0ACC1S7K0_9APHY|nr:hypothetical protein NM688_g7242 [Phlebia brevispora]
MDKLKLAILTHTNNRFRHASFELSAVLRLTLDPHGRLDRQQPTHLAENARRSRNGGSFTVTSTQSHAGLTTAWEPFYSSSSSLSAHSTASVMSLQGKNPLSGHPKTLRDLTHISEMLTLPLSFGAIQLGETFSGCLSVNNEAPTDVEGVTLKVEMQTANTKSALGEYGGPDYRLAAGDIMECIVNHEIKELGQHVLACTVSYRLPEGYRPPHPVTENQDPTIQSFRKFYKFAVTNPLSVKTKINVPRSPTALLSPTEREKVFLEVHIQNLTSEALWLQKMRFECVDGWQAVDANFLKAADNTDDATLFTHGMALIHPQDMRQYVPLYHLAV